MGIMTWLEDADVEDESFVGTVRYCLAALVALFVCGFLFLFDLISRPFRRRPA